MIIRTSNVRLRNSNVILPYVGKKKVNKKGIVKINDKYAKLIAKFVEGTPNWDIIDEKTGKAIEPKKFIKSVADKFNFVEESEVNDGLEGDDDDDDDEDMAPDLDVEIKSKSKKPIIDDDEEDDDEEDDDEEDDDDEDDTPDEKVTTDDSLREKLKGKNLKQLKALAKKAELPAKAYKKIKKVDAMIDYLINADK